jgi:hypothetical protein
MNKLSTLNNYFKEKQEKSVMIDSIDNSLKSNKVNNEMKPSSKVINFLLQYSKSLEAKNGFSYQLN